jgi:hypothetical protein
VSETPEAPGESQELPPLAGPLTLYVLARIVLILVVAGALAMFEVPLFLGLAVGVVLALPLSLLFLGELNHRVSAALAARSAVRKAEQERLRSRLRGDEPA